MTRPCFLKLCFTHLILTFFLISGCCGVKHTIADMMIGYEVRKAGLTTRTLDVNGKKISAFESKVKEGRPSVVLLHGFGASKENWIKFAGHLTNDCHVVAIDLPGHGQSIKSFDIDYSIGSQVGYLHETMNTMGISQFHLAGNSMGGAISAMYTVTYPEQVESLTLMNAGGIYDYESEMARELLAGERNPLIVEDREDFDHLMDLAMEKQPSLPWPLKSVFAEEAMANRRLNEKIFADFATRETGGFKEALTKIQVPTLIIWGEEDRILDVRNAEVFARHIRGAQKHIFEDIGHAPMIEVPEASAKVFLEFISSTNPAD